jgi:uncharacterized protein (DUF433 family)
METMATVQLDIPQKWAADLQSYPHLELEDVQEALSYAAFLADEQVIEFV